MRFLLAGLACLLLGIGLTEYMRRHPSKVDGSTTTEPEAAPDGTKKKPKYPAAVAALLETDAAGSDTPATAPELAELLSAPKGEPIAGFAPIAGGAFTARELRGGFGAALFVMDVNGKSALVRASQGEPPKMLFARNGAIGALAVDGSTVFFSEGGLVGTTHARGGEPVVVRARFKNSLVTSLASSGDLVVVTLMPNGVDPLSTDPVGAVAAISSEGEVTLIAQEQVRPRAAMTDGKDAFWIAGFPSSLMRGALDGAFSSQLSDKAEEPIALDGDGVFFRSPQGTGPELRRVGRAGGNMQTLATADVGFLVASSGLVRFATVGAGPKLMEVTSGAEPTEVMSIAGSPRGLALGGTTLFLLTASDDGKTTLLAK
ncbi:MAG: hypothetical protein Q8N23_16855 [Archangium sp.]|nr:hypothetical protein [Archangium sp.]MDP3154348.1 hypothetical protein [Archangium sp.]MDP3573047.1 hypothetical protein [Archangium sp.]